ncbi:MAG: tRNA (5-methylaminomethyl-2-thiouridine)(34)-methyltransferase MnmD [Casimicrobiaceae bacterium]|nr:tRNA (5-methylaminomethyl-2-thiouridine)(34)-methyltransferase MnmD [Casimicrobiaceae bacterium]
MNAEAIAWSDSGVPISRRYGDRYHAGAPLAQARAVFMAGCGLPQAWRGRAHWAVLENGFGLGSNFLATWTAWRADPLRPARLLYSAIEAHPVERADLTRHLSHLCAAEPTLAPLARALEAAWWGLTPGVHPIDFDDGQVRLVLWIGEAWSVAPELVGPFDCLYLDGFAPTRNPEMWQAPLLRALARTLRPGARAASWCVAGQVRRALVEAGFEVHRAPGLPPKRERLVATYRPWRPSRNETAFAAVPLRPQERLAIVGAGLAGAAVAASLARRGALVQVVSAGAQPADAASAIPAGLAAPQHSRDSSAMTRLTRAGLRLTLAQAQRLLVAGCDFATSGSLQRVVKPLLLGSCEPAQAEWTRAATASEGQAAGLSDAEARDQSLWHPHAAWLRPARLVEALLSEAKAKLILNAAVAAIRPADASAEGSRRFELVNERGQPLLVADRVVVAAGPATRALVPGLAAVRPVVGQLAWAAHEAGVASRFAVPSHGFGHWLPHVPREDGSAIWVLGSTYEPGAQADEGIWQDWLDGRSGAAVRRPAAAQAALDRARAAGRLNRFAAVRATTTDRLPRLGTLSEGPLAGVGYLTALGSRGLTLALLCAETLAATWCDEPPPMPRSLLRLMSARNPT